jgi:hypothetical protein
MKVWAEFSAGKEQLPTSGMPFVPWLQVLPHMQKQERSMKGLSARKVRERRSGFIHRVFYSHSFVSKVIKLAAVLHFRL